MGFVAFMSSTAGRVTRVVAGLVLIIIGALIGGAGWIIAIVGLVPLLAGAFDVCLFGPLLKQPLSGKEVRARTGG
jgi:hypothetical protein